jgi:lipopolysaccharide transport system permease protein
MALGDDRVSYHWGDLSTVARARPESRVAAELFRSLLSRNIKTRYRGSVLGIFWTLLNPAVMMVIYTVVFSVIVRIPIQPYALFLLAGLVPWIAFSQGLSTASVSILSNAPLVKKVYFRLELLSLAEVMTAGVNLVISLGLVLAGLIVYRRSLDMVWLALPFLVLLQLFFTAAVGLILSALTCYFRDLEYLLNLALVVGFYGTPIIFPRSIVPAKLAPFVQANPLSWLTEAYQAVIFYRQWPDLLPLLGFAGITAAAWAVAWLVFSALRPHLPEEL